MLEDVGVKKADDKFFLFAFSFALAIVTYGFALTTFTLSVDNEMPVLQDFGMDLGRWGQNFIRYHLFKGHLPYFTLLLGIFFFVLAALRLVKLFRLNTFQAYLFCALFLTFPQLSYQLVFYLMADVAGLGVLMSVIFVELFLYGWKQQRWSMKLTYILTAAFLLMFMLSIYQAFIVVPAVIMLIIFFLETHELTFVFTEEIKKLLVFALCAIIGILLYIISVWALCPPIENGGYLESFISGDSNYGVSEFLTLWHDNLKGRFYYGERTFLAAYLISIIIAVKIIFNRRHVALRLACLVLMLLLPFLISAFVQNNYHPPRLYLTSNLVYAFIIIFAVKHFDFISTKVISMVCITLCIVNVFFITKLFFTVETIYVHDKRVAEKIDSVIEDKFPNFTTKQKLVYFYGYFPYEYHQKWRLENSEIFGGSIFNWDNGDNYRIINFFRGSGIAEYQMLSSKEQLESVMDSVKIMPVWPDHESVKQINDIIVVKLGAEKGAPLHFE